MSVHEFGNGNINGINREGFYAQFTKRTCRVSAHIKLWTWRIALMHVSTTTSPRWAISPANGRFSIVFQARDGELTEDLGDAVRGRRG
jgi:hypothetical protein